MYRHVFSLLAISCLFHQQSFYAPLVIVNLLNSKVNPDISECPTRRCVGLPMMSPETDLTQPFYQSFLIRTWPLHTTSEDNSHAFTTSNGSCDNDVFGCRTFTIAHSSDDTTEASEYRNSLPCGPERHQGNWWRPKGNLGCLTPRKRLLSYR